MSKSICAPFVCPPGYKFFSHTGHRRGGHLHTGGETFLHTKIEPNIFLQGAGGGWGGATFLQTGGQTFSDGGCGGNDDVVS